MNKPRLRRLLPEEFDAVLLKKLVEEGMVYVDMPKAVDEGAYLKDVLRYVSAIRDFASDEWKDKIDDLWQAIVEDEYFSYFLKMQKGKDAGSMNRYAVTSIVCRMHSKGIYRNDESMMALHLKLEGVSKKNKYYTSCGNYELTQTMRKRLSQLFSRV